MKKLKSIPLMMSLLIIFSLSSCGLLQRGLEPQQEDNKTYKLQNFDRLDIGNAFNISVKKSTTFRIEATGDVRDIEDLVVKEQNGLLKIYYQNKWRIRRYRMEIEIEMPTLKEVDFSGASVSTVKGFNDLNSLRIDLSGASKATFLTSVKTYEIDLSGASELDLEGNSEKIIADLSGASTLNAFDTKVETAQLDISGASSGRVSVSKQLQVQASGASKVRYRGNPEVKSDLSGSSKVTKDQE